MMIGEVMQEYIEVLFRTERTGYFANTKGYDLEPDVQVICRMERGEDIGVIVNTAVPETALDERHRRNEVQPIQRITTEKDESQLEIVKRKEEEARRKFNLMLERQPFVMKLLDAVYQLDGNKLTFFFSADGRIDFREFVRELATEFRTRIELHQSSGREDARRYGGMGMCGKTYCCVSWLKRFNQVTIKMAKDQNLLSNLSKISGPCGRLLCCLNYEEDAYVERARDFPRVEEMIKIDNRRVFVMKNDYYNNKIYVVDEDNVQDIITLDDYKKYRTHKR